MQFRFKHWMLGTALALACSAVMAQSPAADPVGLRGDVGGLWFNPQADGQGLQIDVLDGGRVAVTWYTFDNEGSPLWLFGLGTTESNRIDVLMSSSTGGAFATQPQTALPQSSLRGRLEVAFQGCNEALLSFQDMGAGLGDGTVALQRLSAPQGARCNVEEEFGEQRIFSFELGPGGFEPLFADLPVEGQDIYELDYAYETLPEPLQARRGLRLTGMNRSDDLIMLIKAPLRGLLPDRSYKVEMELEFATSVPTGCVGVGGSPGESVYVKLGAVGIEPDTVVVDEGGTAMLRPNFDFGNQSASGDHAVVVGDLANSQTCDTPDGVWELKTVSTRGQAFRARTDAEGTLWVVAGTDSGFEGLTHVYYNALRVRLHPVSEQ